jgi:hypothetical protein
VFGFGEVEDFFRVDVGIELVYHRGVRFLEPLSAALVISLIGRGPRDGALIFLGESFVCVLSAVSVLLILALRPSPPSVFFLQHRPDCFALCCQTTIELAKLSHRCDN